MFLVDIQCQQFRHLITQKKNTLYGRKDYENFLLIFKRTREKYDWFSKENNVTVNKKRIKIKSRCKSMLNLWKRNLRKAL